MKPLLAATFALVSGAALAQNSTDDQPAQELWWDRVGAGFFSDETMATLRSEDEIRAQLTGLSAEDRAQLIARCDELKSGKATTSQPANEAEVTGQGAVPATKADNGQVAGADTGTATGAAQQSGTTITGEASGSGAAGSEPQVAAPAGQTVGNTGLGPNSGAFTRICDTIARF